MLCLLPSFLPLKKERERERGRETDKTTAKENRKRGGESETDDTSEGVLASLLSTP